MSAGIHRLCTVLLFTATIFGSHSPRLPADLARGTPVTAADGEEYGTKAVETIGFRDVVPALAHGTWEYEWRLRNVKYSFGEEPGIPRPAVRLAYTVDGRRTGITVTEDHLFPVSSAERDGVSFKRAYALIPGADMLLTPEGRGAPIHSITFKTHRGGTHHIATGTDLDDDWNGHLLITNGILSADFLLQATSGD